MSTLNKKLQGWLPFPCTREPDFLGPGDTRQSPHLDQRSSQLIQLEVIQPLCTSFVQLASRIPTLFLFWVASMPKHPVEVGRPQSLGNLGIT